MTHLASPSWECDEVYVIDSDLAGLPLEIAPRDREREFTEIALIDVYRQSELVECAFPELEILELDITRPYTDVQLAVV